MNIPHLQQVLDWLEDPNPVPTLDMGLHFCGTVCCISGYVAKWLVDSGSVSIFDPDKVAAAYLGLTLTEAEVLFYPQAEGFPDWSDITPAQAAQAVRNVMAGDPPNWEDILNAYL